jgi:glycosyltransferase involved in cell wall biosynthesis
LAFEDALRIIGNFKRSGAEYLMATTCPARTWNIDLIRKDDFWRPLNMRLAPFNFPEPLLTVSKACTEMTVQYAEKSLGLWRLSEINLALGYTKIMGSDRSIILNAPNVNSKGGLALLEAFLKSSSHCVRWGQIDRRAVNVLRLPADMVRHHVKHSLLSRLSAEWRLLRITKADDVVLCFHGVPPLFPLRGRVVVLLQNKILVNRRPIIGYPLRTRIRLQLERWMLRILAGHVDKFIVQTPSMKRDTKNLLGIHCNVVILPFAAIVNPDLNTRQKRYDFVYVATDQAHKNHHTLLEAWRVLAEAGQHPVLALTVPVNSTLACQIGSFSTRHQLNITNLGEMNSCEISRLYLASGALIFPSTAESLGLPLVEAAQHGLPILAPEMDYVRDIVDPVETFDPHSPVSIARAVRRFLGKPDPAVQLGSPADFLAEVLK